MADPVRDYVERQSAARFSQAERILELEGALGDLLGFLRVDALPHRYEGSCPDRNNPYASDPGCAACRVLTAAVRPLRGEAPEED